jgi:hypothetical protein
MKFEGLTPIFFSKKVSLPSLPSLPSVQTMFLSYEQTNGLLAPHFLQTMFLSYEQLVFLLPYHITLWKDIRENDDLIDHNYAYGV